MRLATRRALRTGLVVLLIPIAAGAQDREYLNITTPGKGQPVRDASVKDTWSIDCKVDELMDLRYCFIRAVMENAEYVAATSSFTVRVNSDGSTNVWAGGKEFHPETKQMFKIDDNELIKFPSDQPLAAKELLNQLAAGKVLRGRWHEWPSQKQHDETISLVGFEKALEVAQAIVAKRTIPLEWGLASNTAWRWGKMAGYLLRSMNPEFNEIQKLAQSIMNPENGEKCPQLEEAKTEIEKVRTTLVSPYREEFISGYTIGVSQTAGLALTAKECEDAMQSLRLRLKNFALLPPQEKVPK